MKGRTLEDVGEIGLVGLEKRDIAKNVVGSKKLKSLAVKHRCGMQHRKSFPFCVIELITFFPIRVVLISNSKMRIQPYEQCT